MRPITCAVGMMSVSCITLYILIKDTDNTNKNRKKIKKNL